MSQEGIDNDRQRHTHVNMSQEGIDNDRQRHLQINMTPDNIHGHRQRNLHVNMSQEDIHSDRQSISSFILAELLGTLTDDELETLNYKISKRYSGGCYHLFNIVDVKDLAYKKYGMVYDYEKYLLNKSYIKLLTKKEKDKIYKERENVYEQLFIKYDYKKNIYLQEIYNEYINYSKNGFPRISVIENKIILKKELIEKLNEKNIDYFETKEVLHYINNIKNYNIDIAIKSLSERMINEKKYKDLYKPEYDILAYKFINNNINMDILFSIIKNIDIIKNVIKVPRSRSIKF
jgi:hypothetical protein